jgi:hypothetical protein
MLPVEREHEWPHDDYETISGTEVRVTWWSTPRYRYRLRYSALRDDVSAASPWHAYSELDAMVAAYNESKGGLTTYTFVDPLDGTTRNVRFTGPLVKTRIALNWWSIDVELVEVK